MKPIYLSCFLLASLGSSSYAQLPVDSVLDLNHLQDQLENQIQDQVQDQVQEQIINSGVIENQVIDSQVLDNQILGRDALGADLLDSEVLGIEVDDQGLIPGALDDLAKTLPILTRNGATAFLDVEVENGWRAVAYEWLIMVDKTDVKLLQPLQAYIIDQTDFAGLDMVLVRFRVPA